MRQNICMNNHDTERRCRLDCCDSKRYHSLRHSLHKNSHSPSNLTFVYNSPELFCSHYEFGNNFQLSQRRCNFFQNQLDKHFSAFHKLFRCNNYSRYYRSHPVKSFDNNWMNKELTPRNDYHNKLYKDCNKSLCRIRWWSNRRSRQDCIQLSQTGSSCCRCICRHSRSCLCCRCRHKSPKCWY